MFNLLPRDTVFFDLFEGMSRHAVQVAEHLRQFAKFYPDVDAQLQKIRDEEHAADDLAHQALDRLDRTFITPFDREDIHALIGNLDDIIDGVDALAKRFPLFHIKAMDPAFVRQTEVLVGAATVLSEAVHRLRKSRKLSELSDALIAIHQKESEGDDNHHAALSRLFGGDVPPLEVLKWKELFDLVEGAIDASEDAGNTL
ncbi:MAG: phosphate transport regulator, partial [Phycisphaerales bacterium]|nr:phosphate transport regulator [Phycisphaerales bacterium]